jgi:hypothetical protein
VIFFLVYASGWRIVGIVNTHTNTPTGSANTTAALKHLVHLKNRGGTHFAVAEISASKRPSSDLELFKAVAASGGAYVCAFRGYAYDLMNPEWISTEEFERNWIGD